MTNTMTTQPKEIVFVPGAAERDPRAYAHRERAFKLALGILIPLALIALWEVAARNGWISRKDFPPPSRIVEKFWHMATNSGTIEQNGTKVDDGRIYGIFGPPQTLWDLVWTTTRRILVGFAIGTFLGIVMGVLMGSMKFLRAALEPLFNALYTVPKLALTPVFFAIWSLRDDKPMYAVAAITTFFFVWISTMSSVMDVSDGYREAAASFKVSRWEMFRHVIWPASLPQITVGLRIAAGVSVLTVLSVELLLGSNGSGIGTMIFNSKDLALYDQMYVGIVVSAIMGVVFTFIITLISRVLVPWSPRGRAVRVM